ncbi:MAG: AI-2E family transporter [Myxococcota bacterium]
MRHERVSHPPMTEITLKRSDAYRFLLAAACVVVILAGLSAAKEILLPVMLGGFLAVVTVPIVRLLERRGAPSWIAIPAVVIVAAGGLVAIVGIIGTTVRDFAANIGAYEAAFAQLQTDMLSTLHTIGFLDEGQDSLADPRILELVSPSQTMRFLTDAVGQLVLTFGRVIIVVVTMTFTLLEASDLERKLSVAFGSDAVTNPFQGAGEKVTRYVIIKTFISAVTGLLVGMMCRLVGVEFAVMWGLLAFLLNYIPTIGSFVAAIPAMLLSLVTLGWEATLGLGIGYLIINTSLGNFIEPRLMGQSLGLSPLVVFFSLVFWGWLWGPVGMLLCVPLTVIAKLVLESNDDTRWVAVLLGSPRDAKPSPGPSPFVVPRS